MFDNLRRYAATYAVAIGGILMTCLSSWNVRQELQTSHLKEFQWAAGDRIQAVRSVVDQGLDALLEICGLFYAAQGIDEQEFLVFTDSILKRRPYIHSLLWAPLLNSPQQASPGSAPGTPPASPATRVPVLLAAARSEPAAAQGVDLNTTPELAALLQRARESGNIAVSGRIDLVRPGRETVRVIYAALPVYAPGQSRHPGALPFARKQADPLGFVVGVYDIEELVHVAINLLEPRGVEVLVRDDSAGGDAQFLHFYASRLEPRAAVKTSGLMPAYDEDQPSMVVGIPVGDRSWSIICVATHTFRSAEAFTEAHWSVLVGGFLFTALLAFYLVLSRREL